MGVYEIAEMLGVSRQRVDQLLRDDSTFPKPHAHLRMGRVWRKESIEKWISRKHERPKR